MIDTYYSPIAEKQIQYEADHDILFATPPVRKPNIGRLPVPPKLSATQVTELGKKLNVAGQVGLGWLR